MVLGIGSWMLKWAETRAMKALNEIPADLRFAPRIGIYSQAKESQKLFADFGYGYIRSSYRMLIHLDALPPEPVWPEGITVRAYNPQTDVEVVFRADQEIFRDHFGFVEESYEEGSGAF